MLSIPEAFAVLMVEGRIRTFNYELGMGGLSDQATELLKAIHGDSLISSDMDHSYLVLKIENELYYEGVRKPPVEVSPLNLKHFLNQFITNHKTNNGKQDR
jgi:hypothetical protein